MSEGREGSTDEPADPAPPAPWALQLAVRVERSDPPTVAAVCRAAAEAVLALLDHEEARPGGAWHEAVATWRDGRIRKLVRRGRGAAWVRAQDVAGVTVAHGAEVRAFVPTPMDRIDDAVAKLQIDGSGAPLEEPPADEGIGAPPGALVVALTPLVEMTWGKRAAQVAHGAQLARERASGAELTAWQARGRPVTVLFPTPAAWSAAEAVSTVQVHDGGFTEIPAGTRTAVAWFAPAG